MWMTDYVGTVKRAFRDQLRFTPLPGSTDDDPKLSIPDGRYTLKIEGKATTVKVIEGRLQLSESLTSEPTEHKRETFNQGDVEEAIKQWLAYGEQSYVANKPIGDVGNAGYFSERQGGWAARVLRYHLTTLEARGPQAI